MKSLDVLKKSFSTRKALAATSRDMRATVLASMARKIEGEKKLLAELIVDEVKKPVRMANAEVARAVVTFSTAAAEALRFAGDLVALDVDSGSRSYLPATSLWVPRGVVFGITPFNFPLNLVAHKVAPALASANPIIIKPAPHGVKTAQALKRIFDEANRESGALLPEDAFQVLFCDVLEAEKLLRDRAVATVSFTGSTKVGWHLQSLAVGKRVLLELGGNAGVIVADDADLDRAAARCAFGGFAYAGQSCISVQRVYVHRSVSKSFCEKLLLETKKVGTKDLKNADVLCGPVIDEAAAKRIEASIAQAVDQGAKLLCGGKRSGDFIEPALVFASAAGRLRDLPICSEEIFGPVIVIEEFSDFSEALAMVNDSKFGLQAGVFTNRHSDIQRAVFELEVGGVLINDVPTFRSDPMPYGGVKESGLGREGLRYAMEEFSERKTVVEWAPPRE